MKESKQCYCTRRDGDCGKCTIIKGYCVFTEDIYYSDKLVENNIDRNESCENS